MTTDIEIKVDTSDPASTKAGNHDGLGGQSQQEGEKLPQSIENEEEKKDGVGNTSAFVSGQASVGFSKRSKNEDSDLGVGDDHDDDEDYVSQSDESSIPDSLLWRARILAGNAVNNERVQLSIIFLIIVNALMMGFATTDWVDENPDVEKIFTRVDRFFLVIFSIEVFLQLFYLGLTLFSDGWLVFDFFIVVFSWSFESLQIIRAFRIFRAFRLITRVKSLRDLVLAIGEVMPRMYAITALLLLVFYIFSVLFTELFGELELSEKYFTTLDRSLFTCMEMMTLEWGEIAREVMEQKSYAWAPFLAFIMITGFIVFNLIVAVVCDAVAITEKNVRELDGIESDDPRAQLDDAQERIDLLQCHISDMQKTQEAIVEMIEAMAKELVYLETEKLKAEHREGQLRIEMDRRLTYQKDMDSDGQRAFLEKNYQLERSRRESMKHSTSEGSSEIDGSGLSSSRHRRRNSGRSLSGRSVSSRGSRGSRGSRRSSSARDLLGNSSAR